MRERGLVVWFNPADGEGRIRADADGTLLFVHFSFITSEGQRALSDGQRVEFERQPSAHPAGEEAILVVPLDFVS
jgi:CspA family cold shock protein